MKGGGRVERGLGEERKGRREEVKRLVKKLPLNAKMVYLFFESRDEYFHLRPLRANFHHKL